MTFFRSNQSRWLTLVVAALLGLIAAWWSKPWFEREWAYRSLFSADAESRETALRWMFEADPRVASDLTIETARSEPRAPRMRLARDTALALRIISRLDRTEPPVEILEDAVHALRETDWWHPDYVPAELWCRRVEMLLAIGHEDAARTALDDLARLPVDVDTALVNPLWQRLVSADLSDSLRRDLVLDGLAWYGRDREEAERLILAPTLDDGDPMMRRLAWIGLGLVSPRAGYVADWKDEPDQGVTEAILWSSMVTNPDLTDPLREAVEQSPWPTPALPYLLSHSPDGGARDLLADLVADGNPSAEIPLIEAVGKRAGLISVPARVAAWLGIGDVSDYQSDPVAERWFLWRRGTGTANSAASETNWSHQSFLDHFWSPRAEDGSVWAIVLLAERLLRDEEAHIVARTWMRSLNNDDQRAGLLLAGLLGGPKQEITRLEAAATDPTVRRYTRLARLAMLDQKALHRARHSKQYQAVNPRATEQTSAPSDPALSNPGNAPILLRAFAYRLIDSELEGADLDALLALLAAGDRDAVRLLLEWRHTERASSRMLRASWLIERFLPEEYDRVAPLSPWNENIAALQLDILQVAHALQSHEAREHAVATSQK